MAVLDNLQPKLVFKYFEEISQIPRGSGNEKGISDYLLNFGKSLGLESIQDEALNIIIKKSATKGYENAPTVILQGHMDMVCEKNKGTNHDFEKDPLKLRIVDDYIYATDTTLGADNGIAVAYAMAILASDDVMHPSLEVLITTDEETGMSGAMAVSPEHIHGKILINLDNEEEGYLLVSCAGGIRTKGKLPVIREERTNGKAMQIKISGLKGGHSGMDIIKERIKREFNIDIIATSPSVIYEVILTSGETVMVDNPCNMPDKTKIRLIKEPYVKASIFVPSDYIGAIMNLCEDRRGIYKTTEFIDPKRVNIIYELPLAEIVYDFFDKLKSYTKGYASLDYELSDYKVSDLVKMDILINGEVVDALSLIVYKGSAYNRGHAITKALRTLIPRQMFEVPIQASVGSKVISRETISAMRKNVLAKCYGGDVSRKRKLLEKQKEGKKRMKMVGSVEVPPEAFLSILQEGE